MAFKSYYKLVKYEKPLPFYVEDVSGNANTISITKSNASAPTLTIETSTDNRTWATLGQTDTTALNISVPANGRVYVRCSATAWANSGTWGYAINNTFSNTTGNFKIGGNTMSLLYGSNFTGNETVFPSGADNIFSYLFKNNNHLTDAGDLLLPATTVPARCYHSMFYGCTALTTAPELPATTVANSCYDMMFSSCSSLTQAPSILPATTAFERCYAEMFSNCTSLTAAPVISATTMATESCRQMFNNCTSLTAAPALPATTLGDTCYEIMFQRCTSLTAAPALPATTLVNKCYSNMFYGCTSLNSVTCLATDISASNCTNNWLNGVSATGTFTKSPNMSSWTTGTSGIPSGWTVQDAQ